MTSETTIAGERTLLTPDQAQNLRDLAKVIGKLGAALPMPYQLYVTLLEKTLEGVAMLGNNKVSHAQCVAMEIEAQATRCHTATL